MSWETDELRPIQVGHRESDAYQAREIPAPYDRIVAQLIQEDEHAEEDHGHEALRRQSYARRVLNSFWKEIKQYDGEPKHFRPKSLTPLLQRQLAGVEENYSPSVMQAVSNGQGTPTIEQATHFYLRDDPCVVRWIPNFRRNLVHIPEARWHLGIVLGENAAGDPVPYGRVRTNMDVLARYAKQQAEEAGDDAVGDTNDEEDDEYADEAEIDPESIPVFNEAEVQVIVNERLEKFFSPELERVVGVSRLVSSKDAQLSSLSPICREKLWKSAS